MERTILHCDCNNFYASVECLYNPELRNKPVAVAGDVEQRHGIVLAKNYIAKRYGVTTGNPLWMAKKLCPEIIFVPPHYDKYLRFSRLAREIYESYTDQVESFGLDECWLDVTGSAHLFGNGRTIADEIRRRIKYELGITVSVGVSYNKVFAKLGSDMKKPDATTVISRTNYQETAWGLPVSDLLYVGPATKKLLERYYIRTIGDLAQTQTEFLLGKLGKIGRMLWRFANGYDTSPVTGAGICPAIKSIGNSTTTPHDLVSDDDVKITLYLLCESIAERMREQHLKCSTVQISLRDVDLVSFERQCKLDMPICNAATIFKKAFSLYRNHKPEKPLRSIGVRGCQLSLNENIQMSLMEEEKSMQKLDDLEQTIDSIRRRFGFFSLRRGIMLADEKLSNLDPKRDHVIHPIGFLNGENHA